MGEPILKASNVPTKLPANEGQSVVKSELTVDGVTWNVTCVSMGNPHCVTFGPKGSEVHPSIVIRFTVMYVKICFAFFDMGNGYAIVCSILKT